MVPSTSGAADGRASFMRFGLRDGDGEARTELLERLRDKSGGVFLTTAEAALLLVVTPATVRRWADDGRLPVVRSLGGHRRFPAEAVLEALGAEESGSLTTEKVAPSAHADED